MRRVNSVVILTVATAALCGCDPQINRSLPGTIERDRIELIADAQETIRTVTVREGLHVDAGAVLLTQDGAIADAELAAASARRASAQARLNELANGPLATTLRAAVARRDRARVTRDEAARERERLRGLVARQLVSSAELDRQTALAEQADAGLREADAGLSELQRGTRSEQLDQARRGVEASVAERQVRETQRSRLELRAPVAGTIDALPFKVGEKPARGAVVAVLLADGAPYVRIHVPEPLLASVRVGTRARISVDGRSGSFMGTLRFIASQAEFTPYYSMTSWDRSRLSFAAEVELVGADAMQLPVGVPATVEFELTPAP